MSKLVFDISEWQESGTVDRIKNLGGEGIIFRLGLTYGGIPDQDRKVEEFMADAVRLNIPFGLYYYNMFKTDGSALVEAQWMNDRIWEIFNVKYPSLRLYEPELGLWWDVEDQAVANQWTHDIVIKSVETMRSWGFKKVGVYSSYSWFHCYLDPDEFAWRKIPIWVAQYDKNNDLRDERPDLVYHGWQFTDNYQGNCLDASVWYV